MRKYFFARLSIAFFSVLLLIGLAIFFSIYFTHSSMEIGQIAHGVNHHKNILTLIRVVFYFLFFLLWPKLMAYRAKKYDWPDGALPKAIALRYPILMFFLVLEALGQFGPALGS